MNTLPGLPFPVAGHDVVVVDVEGNGQQLPEIVEIALLPLSSGREVTPSDLRTWLIRPSRSITGLVTRKVHGITNDDVADAPRWPDVADEITAALADRVVVAHNATVERRVLAEHLPNWRPPLLLDTLRLAKTVWPDLDGGYGLDRLIRHAALTPPDTTTLGTDTPSTASMRRHRAAYDTWMTASLLVTMLRAAALDWDGLLTAARLPDPRPPRPSVETTEHGGLW